MCLVIGPRGLETNTYILSEEEDIVIIRSLAEIQVSMPDPDWPVALAEVGNNRRSKGVEDDVSSNSSELLCYDRKHQDCRAKNRSGDDSDHGKQI